MKTVNRPRRRTAKPTEPSAASLKAMPERDFAGTRVRRNHHAARIAKEGITVQIGRGRPRKLAEVGGTSPRSVRSSDPLWAMLTKRAKDEGLSLHAALRQAILAWLKRAT